MSGGGGSGGWGKLARLEQDKAKWGQDGQEVSPGPIKCVYSAGRVYGSPWAGGRARVQSPGCWHRESLRCACESEQEGPSEPQRCVWGFGGVEQGAAVGGTRV